MDESKIISNFHGMSIKDFEKMYKQSKLKRDAERWLAIKLAAKNKDIHEIAETLGHDERTIADWISRFNEKGADGIIYIPPDGSKKN